MSPRRAAAILVGLGAAVLVAAPALAVEPAPDYEARLLGTDREVALVDYRGEVLLLNTWATWCEPCKEEMPDFEEVHRRYGSEGLRVIGVNTDEGSGDGAVTRFVEGLGVTFEIWRDPRNRFADEFRVLGPPETFLIDRGGDIVRHWRGQTDPGAPENLESITAALAGDSVPAASAAGTVATAGLLIAFGAGLLSVLSPCVLPLVPSYASVVAGVSLGRRSPLEAGTPVARSGVAGSGVAGSGMVAGTEVVGAGAPNHTAMSRQAKSHEHRQAKSHKQSALRAGLAFVAGFTSVFMALGILVNRAGAALADNREWLTRAGGVVLVVLGLHLIGLLRIRAADREARLFDLGGGSGGRGLGGRAGYAGAFLVGVAFAAGWSPCVGPVLAGILTMAASGGSTLDAAVLLAAYSAGLAIPFLAAALALDRFMTWSAALRRSWLPVAERVSGALVIAIGVLLLTGVFSRMASWLA